MRIRDHLFLAYKNVCTYKKNTILVVVSFVMVTTLIVCFASYLIAGKNELNNLLYKRASECFYSTSETINTSLYDYVPEVKDLNRFYYKELNKYSLVIDGEKSVFTNESLPYMVNPDDKYDGYGYYSMQIDSINNETDLFTSMDNLELKSRYDTDIFMIDSIETDTAKKVFLSQTILELYGIKDYESVLGKELSIVSEDDNNPIIEDFAISGIISSKYFQMSGTYMDSHVMIIGNENDVNSYEYNELIYRYYAHSFEDAKDMYDLGKRNGLPLYKNYTVDMYESMMLQKNVVSKIILVALILTIFMVFLYVLVTEYFSYSKKQIFIQTELYLGMNRNDVLSILCLENIIYLLLSLIISFAIIPVILMNLRSLVISEFRTEISFNYAYVYLLLILVILILAALSYVLSLIMTK